MSATDEPELTPDERMHEIATVLAAGILRLASCPNPMLESDAPGPESGPEKLSDSAKESLLCDGRSYVAVTTQVQD